jgi:glucoselysine-6-phosphate deglycase
MKSIEDYVHLEPEFYQEVMSQRKELFENKFANIDVSNIDNVVIYATGSSSNAAFGALPFVSKVLGLPVRIEEPSISENYLMNVSDNTLCIAISQGGHSYSVVELVDRLQKAGHTVFALTSEDSSPLAQKSDNLLMMGMPIEEMPYVSAGYSVAILDLILIALTVSRMNNGISETTEENYYSLINKIISKVPKVVEQSTCWVEEKIDQFSKAERIIFIGYGATYGVAREGETKITEAVRVSAWGKELEEYMHGPYLGLHKKDFIVFIEPDGKLQGRANLLKKFLNQHVDNIFTIYANDRTTDDKDLHLSLETDELLAALFMTIPIHLLAYRLSKIKKIDLEASAYPDFDKITASKI